MKADKDKGTKQIEFKLTLTQAINALFSDKAKIIQPNNEAYIKENVGFVKMTVHIYGGQKGTVTVISDTIQKVFIYSKKQLNAVNGLRICTEKDWKTKWRIVK